jgi:hypothetical protein
MTPDERIELAELLSDELARTEPVKAESEKLTTQDGSFDIVRITFRCGASGEFAPSNWTLPELIEKSRRERSAA